MQPRNAQIAFEERQQGKPKYRAFRSAFRERRDAKRHLPYFGGRTRPDHEMEACVPELPSRELRELPLDRSLGCLSLDVQRHRDDDAAEQRDDRKRRNESAADDAPARWSDPAGNGRDSTEHRPS
jgi:hypothetical protein